MEMNDMGKKDQGGMSNGEKPPMGDIPSRHLNENIMEKTQLKWRKNGKEYSWRWRKIRSKTKS
jgi:hypothetical protein